MPSDNIKYLREARLMQIADELFGVMEVGEDGNVSWSLSVGTEIRFSVIENSILIPAIQDNGIKRKLISDALRETRRDVHPTLASFKTRLDRALQQHLRSPLKEYEVVFFLNVSIEWDRVPKTFKVLGHEIQTLTRPELESKFEMPRFKDKLRRARLDDKRILRSINYTPFEMRARGFDSWNGINAAANSFETLRAGMNFVHNHGWHLSFPRFPIGHILPSPAYGIFETNGEFVEMIQSYFQPKYETEHFTSQEVESLEHLLNQLQSPRDSVDTMNLIVNGLQKYGEAMDALEWSQAFLPFWQVLESVTLLKENLHLSDVVKRTKTIVGGDSLTYDLIDCLKEIRNGIVHEGRFLNTDSNDVMNLKLIVELVLNFLLDRYTDFPTVEHLGGYYSDSSNGNA